jgi:hypothetical protein
LRERKEKTDPRGGMEDRRLLDREKRLPRELKSVPERKPTVLHRVANGLPPRDLLVDDVAQDRRPCSSDSLLVAMGGERLGLIGDVEGRIDARRDHRFPGEEKRAERDQDCDARPEARDEAVDEKKRQRARREVDGEQPESEQEQAVLA